MIPEMPKKKIVILVLALIMFPGFNFISGQVSDSSGQVPVKKLPDPYVRTVRNDAVIVEPDTNFTFERYADFLKSISDPQKFTVLPLNEFRTTFDTSKIIIGLRHDVDNDLTHAVSFSDTEYKLGFRSTYFILHTAPYYLQNFGNMAVHTENIIPVLKKMQDDKHFEIGWHNDLVTLQVIYKINSVDFLQNELAWLRSKGLKITGTASHGSPYAKMYNYINFYFFEECSSIILPCVNNITVPFDNQQVKILKGRLNDFSLDYEAYFLNNNKYYSDAAITNGIRWNTSMLDISQLLPGDRVIILVHPIHWHRASVKAGIDMFSITGQKAAYVDTLNSSVTVIMPHDAVLENLTPSFRLSPGALAKVSGAKQTSNYSVQDFSYPVTYSVFAENRLVQKDWTINVRNELVLDMPGEEERADSMEIYPNPAEALVNIKITGSTEPQKIEIFSFDGKKVYEEILGQTGDFTKQADLSFLSPGIYLVRNATTGKKAFLLMK